MIISDLIDELIKKCYTYYKSSTIIKVINMKYKELVKKLRDKLIITQGELAELLGVSFASINRWETGKHEPTTKVKRRIVELCKKNNVILEDENNG